MDNDKINVRAQITKYENNVNNSFAKIKIFVDTHEQVANGTKFSKELLSAKMSTLNYLPIVAEFKEENNDFGGHGGKIELSDDGVKWIDTTRPYGVVIEDSGRFESVHKKNGETIEYVVCDGYVWVERYPELNVLFEGKPNNQSMEINILAGHYGDDGIYYVDDFEYSALCILGKDVIPAFDLARIEGNFETKDFKSQYEEMISALEKYLESNSLTNHVDDLEEAEDADSDGIDQKYEETSDFIEDNAKTEQDGDVDDDDEGVDYQALYESQLNDINELKTKYDKLKLEFEEYKNNYSTPNSDVEDLKQQVKNLTEFKEQKLAEERKEAEEMIFAQFDEKLKDVDEYEQLKQNASNYELDALEKECFVILGKKNANFSSKPKPNKVKIAFNKTQELEDEFADLFKKYLKK